MHSYLMAREKKYDKGVKKEKESGVLCNNLVYKHILAYRTIILNKLIIGLAAWF